MNSVMSEHWVIAVESIQLSKRFELSNIMNSITIFFTVPSALTRIINRVKKVFHAYRIDKFQLMKQILTKIYGFLQFAKSKHTLFMQIDSSNFTCIFNIVLCCRKIFYPWYYLWNNLAVLPDIFEKWMGSIGRIK